MKVTGVTRPIDTLGRVVIPKELRRQLNWNEEDRVEFFVENDSVTIKKYSSGCNCCKRVKSDLKEVDGIILCKNCIGKFKSLLEGKNEN
ncbi:AbrB/MazE/SpoVT family DNA-binding domain-containing protein [Clostridium chromiireducens]|uniref:Transition state regulatory protein AbrB n=1 Tax=Clostridium chromiireducens TaxID=225345 RepID=A0A1V4IK39_9CLOT|nr:AbrB/MazE/SpoVT family DNA-binding domain-containing protein [Clostridium chromiireducens]OPJ60239.1 transition state regulatory protein AbrB [Clostridium chromiireducens]